MKRPELPDGPYKITGVDLPCSIVGRNPEECLAHVPMPKCGGERGRDPVFENHNLAVIIAAIPAILGALEQWQAYEAVVYEALRDNNVGIHIIEILQGGTRNALAEAGYTGLKHDKQALAVERARNLRDAVISCGYKKGDAVYEYMEEIEQGLEQDLRQENAGFGRVKARRRKKQPADFSKFYGSDAKALEKSLKNPAKR